MTYSTEVSHTQTVTGNRDFSVTFPFLAVADIRVQLNGVTKTVTNDYTIVQSGANTVVNFNTAPADNATIRIFRDTDIDAINATYAAGSAIRSTDLNSNNSQLLYAAQEFGTLKEDNSVSFTLGNKGDIQVNSSSDWIINNNAVELANLADNSVGTSELVNDCVTNDKIKDLAVLSNHIGNLNVTEPKIASNAVTTVKINDNAVTTAKIADDAIIGAKIADDAVDTDQIAVNAIITNRIDDDAVTLDKLADAVILKLVPVGTVIWYAGTTAPSGFLKCNGDSISDGMGTTQGQLGDFSTLFNLLGGSGASTPLPDLRGEFIRALDDGRGVDSGRGIRSGQGSQFTEHRHWISSADRDDANMTGTGANEQNYGLFADSGSYSENDPNRSTGRNTANTGQSENRPRNVALLACIKY